MTKYDCPDCNGQGGWQECCGNRTPQGCCGEAIGEPCERCDATGKLTKEELTVDEFNDATGAQAV